jgi:hypothetical protein
VRGAISNDRLYRDRTCHSHLAGQVGVQIADGLQMCGLLKRGDAKTLSVTASGIDWFTALGIDLRPSDIKAPSSPAVAWIGQNDGITWLEFWVLRCTGVSRR